MDLDPTTLGSPGGGEEVRREVHGPSYDSCVSILCSFFSTSVESDGPRVEKKTPRLLVGDGEGELTPFSG